MLRKFRCRKTKIYSLMLIEKPNRQINCLLFIFQFGFHDDMSKVVRHSSVPKSFKEVILVSDVIGPDYSRTQLSLLIVQRNVYCQKNPKIQLCLHKYCTYLCDLLAFWLKYFNVSKLIIKCCNNFRIG